MFLPQSPLWQGDFCTQENASVRQVRARTMRAAVQNRPGRASGRTACEPSGPPIASDSPRTKSSDVAGAVGASGRSMSSDGSMLMSWHHAVSGCATVTSAAPSRNAAGIGLDPDATGAHPMGYAPVSAQRATLIVVAVVVAAGTDHAEEAGPVVGVVGRLLGRRLAVAQLGRVTRIDAVREVFLLQVQRLRHGVEELVPDLRGRSGAEHVLPAALFAQLDLALGTADPHRGGQLRDTTHEPAVTAARVAVLAVVVLPRAA